MENIGGEIDLDFVNSPRREIKFIYGKVTDGEFEDMNPIVYEIKAPYYCFITMRHIQPENIRYIHLEDKKQIIINSFYDISRLYNSGDINEYIDKLDRFLFKVAGFRALFCEVIDMEYPDFPEFRIDFENNNQFKDHDRKVGNYIRDSLKYKKKTENMIIQYY